MPYTEKQLRLFHGIKSGSIPPRKGLTRSKAAQILAAYAREKKKKR